MKPLPKNARMLKSVKTTQISGWAEMSYDAEMYLHGIQWLRVKDGMGGGGDREDWVAVVPYGTFSVHDYQWREPRCGFVKVDSIEEAMEVEIKNGVVRCMDKIKATRDELELMEKSFWMLKSCLPNLDSVLSAEASKLADREARK